MLLLVARKCLGTRSFYKQNLEPYDNLRIYNINYILNKFISLACSIWMIQQMQNKDTFKLI